MTKVSAEVLAQFTRVNVNRFFKMELLEQRQGEAKIRLALTSEYAQETSIVHGGIITTLADTACVYTFIPHLSPDEMPSSIEFKVNFLNAAFVDKGDLISNAKAIKSGKSVIVCEAEVLQSEKLIAKGLFTYLRFKRKT